MRNDAGVQGHARFLFVPLCTSMHVRRLETPFKHTRRKLLIDRRSPLTVSTWAAAAAVDPLRGLLEPANAHFTEEGGASALPMQP